ncbi:MAG: hypothetical protein PHS92_05050 [Candidatus Gracilibacteria bacterium]|nr:hypothetical protein [Candidatus Gracilibacteria bacterium]
MQSNEQKPIIGHSPEILSPDDYVMQMQNLVRRSIKNDPTLVLHSAEEIRNRYENSIIAVLDNKIIGNTSIYPTKMKPLDMLNGQKIGECGSTVVEIDKRHKGLGKALSAKAMKILSKKYNALICATINERMENIRKSLGFEYVRFPQEYYDEGRKYLSPLLKGGIIEFESRAKCMMNFLDSKDSQKRLILDILDKQ